jgi:hypothetical protein
MVASSPIDVPFAGAVDTGVLGINSRGEVVGYYDDNSSLPAHGFVHVHGSFTSIDVPSAASTVVEGINDSGEITGYYRDATGRVHGFVATPR